MKLKTPYDDFLERSPRFLIGYPEAEDDREYVIHLHYPRFIGEILYDERGGGGIRISPVFIDDPMDFCKTKTGSPAQIMARLMRETGDWYTEQLKS